MRTEYQLFLELAGIFIGVIAALMIIGSNFKTAIVIAALIVILDILFILLLNRSIAVYRLKDGTQEQFPIIRIVFLNLIFCMIFWVIYGVVWEVSYDLTTPPLSTSPGGYAMEHTVGIYIFLSLAAGVLFTLLGTLLTIIISVGYAMTRAPMGSIWTYAYTKKQGIAFVLIALALNIIVSILPYIVKIPV